GTAVEIGPGGGTLRSPDDRVEVRFPAGAVKGPVTARYTPSLINADYWAWCTFSLTADERGAPGKPDQAKASVRRFEQPLTVVVRLDQAKLARASAESAERLALWYWDVGAERWVPVPSQVDVHAGTLTAQVTHFTDYAAGGGDPFDEIPLPTTNDFDSDLFTGAATIRYPIAVPPGNHGLAPAVQLAFNSQGLEEVKSAKATSWVGQGWGLDLPHIRRASGDRYYLVLGDVKGKLVGEYNSNYYHLVDTHYLRVWKDGDNFYLRTQDDTLYEFTHQATTCVDRYDPGCDCWSRDPVTYRWSVTRIVDAHGNQVTFEYEAYTVTSDGCANYKAIYPTVIRYGGDNQQRYAVHFIRIQRQDATHYAKLDRIEIKVDGTVAWSYVFTYDDDPENAYKGRLTLLQIQRYGRDGGTLPPYTFVYAIQDGKVLLTTAGNGYGGQMAYTYQQFETYGGNYRHRVQQRTASDGLGHTFPITYTYTYDTHGNEKFVGHEMVKVEDAVGGLTYQWFHLDTEAYNPLQGRSWKTEHRDADGILLAWEYQGYTWRDHEDSIWREDVGWLTVHWYFVALDQAESHLAAQHRYTTYTYDVYGNQATVSEYGKDHDLYRRTQLTYLYRDEGTTGYLVNRAQRRQVFDASGTEVARADYLYDRDAGGSLRAWEALPTRGDLVAERAYSELGPDRFSQAEYWYDGYGNQVQARDANGHDTVTSYDSIYPTYPLHVTPPTVNGVTLSQSFTYDYVLGTLQTTTDDANQLTTAYGYDEFGRVKWAQLPGDPGGAGGCTYEREYLDLGNPTTQRVVTYRGRGADRLYETLYFNGLGQKTEIHTPGSGGQEVIARWAYDELGRVEHEWVPQLGVPENDDPHSTTEYDALGRVTKVQNPDGTETQTIYHTDVQWADQIGVGLRQEEVIDAEGHKTYYTYDAFDQLVWVGQKDDGGWCDALHVALYDYDVLGNLVQVTSGGYICGTTYTPGDITIQMTYDQLGRKIAMHDPDMCGADLLDPAGWWKYEYDDGGNLLKQTDAQGQELNFEYDALNRLVVKKAGDVELAHYYYDENGYGKSKGQRTRMTYGGNTTYYYYFDDVPGRGRLRQTRHTIDGTDYDTHYTYDTLDRVVTMTYPDTEVVTMDYDDRGLPYSLTSNGPDTYISAASYNAQGQIKQLDLGNGAVTTYAYYGDGSPPETAPSFRLWQLRTVQGSTELQNLEYTYDNVGNVETIKDYKAPGGTQTQNFGYDALNRLTSASASDGSAGQYTRSYEYDGIGNITSRAGVTYGYGQAQGIAPGAKPHAVTHLDGEERYQYDANGNMTSRTENGVTYGQSFDAENRLHVVTAGAEVTVFTYDGDGARVKKVDSSGTTIYVGNYYEKLVLNARTWTFTGRVQTSSVLLAGATVRLDHQVGGDWVTVDTQTTGGDGGFGLSYTGYEAGDQTFRLVETNPVCYQSTDATAGAGLTKINNDELQGTLEPGTYDGNVFVDASTQQTWTFTGQVQAGGSGLGGATVRLYRQEGTAWVLANSRTTDQDGTFSLSYTGCGVGNRTFRLVETNPACYESVSATPGAPLTQVSADELRGSNLAPGTYGDNTFTDASSRQTWTFTGQVREGGSGLAGATVRLYRRDGADWVYVMGQATGADGAFSLSYSRCGTGNLDVRLVETNPTCYQSSGATPGESFSAPGDDELEGTNLAPGTYGNHTFTDESTPPVADITAVYPAGCQHAAGALPFRWTLPCNWSWDSYTYVLRDLDAGQDVNSGSTTETTVALPVAGGTNYRFIVTGHKAGQADVSKSTEVSVAYPAPTNLQPDGEVWPGPVAFTWTPPAPGVEVTYQLKCEGLRAHSGECEDVVGTTTESTVKLDLSAGYYYIFSVWPTGECNAKSVAETEVSTASAPCNPLQNGGFTEWLSPWAGTGIWTGSVGHAQAGAAQLGSGQYVEQVITPGQAGMTLHVWAQGIKAQLRVQVQDNQMGWTYADQSFALESTWTECRVAVSDHAASQACRVRLSSTSGTLYADDVAIICGEPPKEGQGSRNSGWAQAAPADPAAPDGSGQGSSRPAGLAALARPAAPLPSCAPAPLAQQATVITKYRCDCLSRGAGLAAPPACPLAQQPSVVIKYYVFNGKRVAMRRDGVLHFIHQDHLGSTSLLTDQNGDEVDDSRLYYYPYGSVRAGDPAALPTEFNFTGQRLDRSTGLLYYGARYYDPLLGRFISADTVVPGAGNPQNLNRYSYVRNNPLKYTDPTGHRVNNDWVESDWDWQAKTPWQGKERGEDWATYYNRVGCHGDNGEGLVMAAAAPFVGVGMLAGFDLAYIGASYAASKAVPFLAPVAERGLSWLRGAYSKIAYGVNSQLGRFVTGNPSDDIQAGAPPSAKLPLDALRAAAEKIPGVRWLIAGNPTPGPQSDLDLVMVGETQAPAVSNAVKAALDVATEAAGYGGGVQIIPKSVEGLAGMWNATRPFGTPGTFQLLPNIRTPMSFWDITKLLQ
ncbi:MAG: hypothetical protein KKA73_22045, partial [Chloroflexi bacterium]|nr:hypothetical protein [Chloroflexota bacterium]